MDQILKDCLRTRFENFLLDHGFVKLGVASTQYLNVIKNEIHTAVEESFDEFVQRCKQIN